MDTAKVPRCSRCGTTEGIRMRKKRGGLVPRSRCDACELASHREREAKPDTRAKRAAYRTTPGRQDALRRYSGSAKHLANAAIWRERYRAAGTDVARSAVNHAVAAGRLVRGPCVRCGKTGRTDGHHHNGYDKAHWLDVMWLCRPCHQSLHRGEWSPG